MIFHEKSLSRRLREAEEYNWKKYVEARIDFFRSSISSLGCQRVGTRSSACCSSSGGNKSWNCKNQLLWLDGFSRTTRHVLGNLCLHLTENFSFHLCAFLGINWEWINWRCSAPDEWFIETKQISKLSLGFRRQKKANYRRSLFAALHVFQTLRRIFPQRRKKR